MSERIIDSVKRCAKRAIEIQGLSFTELQTKMLETELILNNRPLCAIYDSDTKEVLNPNHLFSFQAKCWIVFGIVVKEIYTYCTEICKRLKLRKELLIFIALVFNDKIP